MVQRGREAVALIRNMTSRIPDFIRNSQLEPSNGMFAQIKSNEHDKYLL